MNKQNGISIIEALVAAAVVGIGFVAVYGITTSSTRVLLNSIDREKGNMLANMIMEDIVVDTKNVSLYHNVNFSSSPSSQTTTVEKKQEKWKTTASKLFGEISPSSTECTGGNPKNWKNCHYRKIEVVETSAGSKIYTISVHLSNRDGRAVNTFKRTLNAN